LEAPTNWIRDSLDDEMWGEYADTAKDLRHTLERTMRAEIMRQIVITAIALKRHQLRHGSPAKDLNALVPEFLSAIPNDPVDGEPLRYRSNPDGTFVLYSVGDDGKDDGGDPTPSKSHATSWWWQNGRDWVWPQAATAEEIRNFYNTPPK
jgi:hypothetical protein